MTMNRQKLIIALGIFFQIAMCTTVISEIGEPDSEEYVDLTGEGCGIVRYTSEKRGRVLNGTATTFGEFPWQVLFIDEYGISCGGSLINHDWIVTAAHCFDPEFELNYKNFKVRLGEYDLSVQDEPYKHIERNLVELIMHPEFDSYSYVNDIALIKMDKSVQFEMNIQPICIYNQDNSLVGELPKASGWGTLGEFGAHPDVLQQITLPVLKNKRCEKWFIAMNKKRPLTKIAICAGYKYGKRGTCQGDSGGPLQLKLKNKRWALIGITSWGFGCGHPSSPGIYTRVSYFLNWILNNLRKT